MNLVVHCARTVVTTAALLAICGCQAPFYDFDGTRQEQQQTRSAVRAINDALKRTAQGNWAVADPLSTSDYLRDYPGRCAWSDGGVSCVSITPAQTGRDFTVAAPVTLGNAVATLSDGSRCKAEFIEHPRGVAKTASVLKYYDRVAQGIPKNRSRIEHGMTRESEPKLRQMINNIRDPGSFLESCRRMGAAPNELQKMAP